MKMYYLTVFLKAFCIKFHFDFRSNWPHFSLILDLFDPSFLQNFRSDWVEFFIACWTWLPNIWWSTPLLLPLPLPRVCTIRVDREPWDLHQLWKYLTGIIVLNVQYCFCYNKRYCVSDIVFLYSHCHDIIIMMTNDIVIKFPNHDQFPDHYHPSTKYIV